MYLQPVFFLCLYTREATRERKIDTEVYNKQMWRKRKVEKESN